MFHPLVPAEKTVEKYIREGRITEDDAKLINQYIAKHSAQRAKFGEARRIAVIQFLCYMRNYIHVEYRKANIDDVLAGVGELRRSKYSKNSRRAILAALKQFLVRMSELKILNLPIEELRRIEIGEIDNHTTSPDELLTPEEIKQLLYATTNAKHRCFIALLYESMMRPEEIAALQWRDLVPDRWGWRLYIRTTKTPEPRYVPLQLSSPYIAEWRKVCKGNEYVFPGQAKGESMTWDGMQKIIKRVAEKAGLRDRVKTMYIMRKSRITQNVVDGKNTSAIMEMAWGNQSTRMMSTYVKLSHNKINEMLGIVDAAAEVDMSLLPIRCACGKENESDADYCKQCGHPLSAKAMAAAKPMTDEQQAEANRKQIEAVVQMVRAEVKTLNAENELAALRAEIEKLKKGEVK